MEYDREPNVDQPQAGYRPEGGLLHFMSVRLRTMIILETAALHVRQHNSAQPGPDQSEQYLTDQN